MDESYFNLLGLDAVYIRNQNLVIAQPLNNMMTKLDKIVPGRFQAIWSLLVIDAETGVTLSQYRSIECHEIMTFDNYKRNKINQCIPGLHILTGINEQSNEYETIATDLKSFWVNISDIAKQQNIPGISYCNNAVRMLDSTNRFLMLQNRVVSRVYQCYSLIVDLDSQKILLLNTWVSEPDIRIIGSDRMLLGFERLAWERGKHKYIDIVRSNKDKSGYRVLGLRSIKDNN